MHIYRVPSRVPYFPRVVGIYAPTAPRTLYWVGGAADWDSTDGTKWSLSSGGAGGELSPRATDTVIFDSSSGSGIVTLTSSSVASSVSCTGFGGSFYYAGSMTTVVTDSPLNLNFIGIHYLSVSPQSSAATFAFASIG